MIKIPRKLRKRISSKSNKYYHYEFIKSYPHIVVYKCIETGKNESFNKKDFIVKEI